MTTKGRVLVLTLPPFAGGVPAKAAMLVRHLLARGRAVTVAYYATLSDHPDLLAPSWRLWSGQRPGMLETVCFGDVPAVAVGTWLPELEFTYYLPSARWRDLIAAHDRHLAVGGTSLVSYPLAAAGLPHLVWCAAGMEEDRRDRHASMPLPRRLLDSAVVMPLQSRMERRILSGRGRIATVSSSGREVLRALGGHDIRMLRIPVDLNRFTPPPVAAPAGIIGFAGRLGDPRKNLGMLIEAVRLANQVGAGLRLRLCGEPDMDLQRMTEREGLPVEWLGRVPAGDLPEFYRSLDLFALPSFQEGFGIVGCEAMACGVPVVSTRCGGPADYVIDGETGLFVDFGARAMADTLVELAANRVRRERMSVAARAMAETHYGAATFVDTLDSLWQDVWGERV